MSIDAENVIPPASAEFWTTQGGIGIRLEMLGHQIEYKTFNRAVIITSSSIGLFYFKMIGPGDTRTCEWCGDHIGRVYHQGRFMPELPRHPNCRHYWDIASKGEGKK